jgi:hypothetical protein
MNTNKMKIFLKVGVIVAFYLTSFALSAQVRFVEVVGSNGYDDGGILCLRDGIRYAPFGLFKGTLHLATFTANASSSNVRKYTVQEQGQKIRLRVWCNRHNTAHFSDEFTIPQGGSTASMPGISESNGCVSASAGATANFYDAYKIASVRNLASNDLITPESTTGVRNICVADEMDYVISVAVDEVQNAWNSSHFRLISEYENGNIITSTVLGSTYQGDITQERNIRFREISSAQDIYNKPIYFRVLTQFNTNEEIFEISTTERIGPFTFFRYMPPISDPTVNRSACGNDVINVTLDPSIIPQLSNYRFRIRPDIPGGDQTSNIIPLQPGQPVGNTVPLSIVDLPNFESLIPPAGGNYIMQVFGTELAWDGDLGNITCAAEKTFNILAKPIPLELDFSLAKYTFNSQTYHVSSAGASDGEALLSVQDNLESRIDHYEYYRNGTWSDIPLDQIERRGNTTWYIGLSAGTYQIRVVDTDGCGSEPIEFTLVEPAPLEITNLDSTLVNCHINNLGQHADGQIGIHFTGGIGPYEVEVFNEEGASVYFLEVNAEHFDEGDDICHISTHGNLSVGNYHVVVTDNSGIEDDDYIEVISNPELILSASPMSYDCYGSANGAVTLHLENREGLAVNYGLNGDSIIRSFVDTAYYDYLIEGIYTAGVINSRGCKDIVENIEIRQPNQIQINGMATNPICYNSFDGRITTNVTGGNGGYVYKWSNSETTPSITGLNNGSYTLIITDAKGCTSEDIYTITPPVAPSANWPETSAVLCTGNTKTL